MRSFDCGGSRNQKTTLNRLKPRFWFFRFFQYSKYSKNELSLGLWRTSEPLEAFLTIKMFFCIFEKYFITSVIMLGPQKAPVRVKPAVFTVKPFEK